MRFVLATHAYLLLATLTPDRRAAEVELVHSGYHFGLAPLPASRLLVYYGGENAYQQDQRRLLTYQVGDSAEMLHSHPLLGEWGDVHQIAWANDGLYLTNTQFNTLVYQNLLTGQTDHYVFEGRRHDWNHINSIYPCGRQLFVILHNRARRESQLAILHHDPQRGLELQRTLSLWDRGCHNVFIDGDRLYYSASQVNQLVVVDLTADAVVQRLAFAGWHIKGLSAAGDVIALGLSEHTMRDRRAFTHGRLALIDRRTLALVAEIPLSLGDPPRPIGNINEIRCLSAEELAHARPQPTPQTWEDVRLARRRLWQYWWHYAQTKVVRPLRDAKRYWRERV